MQVIIDARAAASRRRVFDIPIFERILRQLFVLNIRRDIWILNDPSHPSIRSALRRDFESQFNIDFREVSLDDTLRAGPVVLLSGHGIYDDRILERLLAATTELRFVSANGVENLTAATVYLTVPQSVDSALAKSIRITPSSLNQIPRYVRFLRKNITPQMQAVSEGTDLRALERRLFRDTFKGGLELVAIYGYQPLVRELTRWVSRSFITPNLITSIAVVMRFGAMPLMAAGWLGTGLAFAAVFIILDSLDGKLARMTYRFSDTFDKIDHWGSLPARMGWYVCLAWGLSGGQWHGRFIVVAAILVLLTLLDDVNWLWAKRRFDKTLYDLSVLDERVHLFNIRRNDIFFLFAGWSIGRLEAFYFFLPLWMTLIFFWHIGRLTWMTFKRRQHDTVLPQNNVY